MSTDPTPNPDLPPVKQYELRGWVPAIVMGIVLVSWHSYACKPGVNPAPGKVDPVIVGKNYAGVMALTYANAWDRVREQVKAGKPVAEWQKAIQDNWKAYRDITFRDAVKPAMSEVLPEGTEPKDEAQRKAVDDWIVGFQTGLRQAANGK